MKEPLKINKPNKPIRPVEPCKPVEPNQYIDKINVICPDYNQIWSIQDLINNLPENIKLEDIKITVKEVDDYYSSYSHPEIYYISKEINKHYNMDMKYYQSSLKKYERDMIKYEKDMIKYEEQIKIYESKMEPYLLKLKEFELKNLEKRIEKLKKEYANKIDKLTKE